MEGHNSEESSMNASSDKESHVSFFGPESVVVDIRNLDCFYGTKQVVFDANLQIAIKRVTSLIGPSGCGKSTVLRCINRMNDLVDHFEQRGRILIDGIDINSNEIHITELRKRVGMVFQKSNPFPKTIYENVAYGPRIHGINKKSELDAIVERSLRSVALWDEVSDRLKDTALKLSGGQQQRLCIARAIAIEPEVLLMDEPCSALDPIATSKIEDLIFTLKEKYTIVIVTHSMAQAARVSDYTSFLLHGELVEFEETAKLFQTPKDKRTADYIMGRFG